MINDPILRSFEIAAARCEDLTPLVYCRLFQDHPEAEAMFRRDGSDLVKGSMLAFAIEALLDFAGERRGHFRLIECEVMSHDAYGTAPELFNAFFGIIAKTLHDLLGPDWTADIDDGWRKLLDEIRDIVESNRTAAQQGVPVPGQVAGA
jgi:hemoglobin-like flavoprotein